MIKYIKTVQSRLDIGFKEKKLWRSAQAIFTKHTLNILGHPVMEDWEEPYMKALADIASFNGGIILEVGFGMGISARYIQKRDIAKHIIIEANTHVANKASIFKKEAAYDVDVIEGFWEDVIETIPSDSIDGILFDTYPLSEVEIHENHFAFFAQANRLLRPGGVFTYYSDEHTDFSKKHRKHLISAGFKDNYIQGVRIPVAPPPNCIYWDHDTIVAPIIIKKTGN